LIEELEQVRTKDADKDNKLQILPKDTIKAIIGRSPDYSDAMAMRIFYEIDSNYGRYFVH
jgi:phage terminase large subunit